ncbi:hypothetical protein [Pseudomonas koreensis]|uniref:hypothetical protein n=1 Tax=Pseudomonas koreensis TaxID=198620 RepID=UPI001F02E0F0|nr:hypothetical protein [Pseudomonas koreensis]
MEYHVILLEQVEVSALILTWLALQKVPKGTFGADNWHAGKLCNDRKFMQAEALSRAK